MTSPAYPDSVRYLYSLGNEVKTAKLGLDRMRALSSALGNPERSFRIVHVAGTNGKGSTAAMVASSLKAWGAKTGLYTSPHLVEPTERISIGCEPVSRDEFAAAFDRVHRTAEELLRDGAIDFHPTYFETVTAMAFVLFRDRAVEWAVVEVGLGGRLDATNIVLPELAVVTPVDFDHEAYLGRSLEAIAGEKAGILKTGVKAVFASQRPEVKQVLEEAAHEVHAPFTTAEDWHVEDLEVTARGSRFTMRNGRKLRIECPLAGEHQVANTVTAAAALDSLGLPERTIEDGIRTTRWPGRLEYVGTRPDILLDGAHNPSGARALAKYVERFREGRRLWLVYAAMRDKAVSEVAGILFPLADQVIATAPNQSRAVRPEVIAEIAGHPHLRVAPHTADALALIAECPPEDVVLITGSLYLVGEMRPLFVK
ncbi:MAG: bifunctional folylpolyglutamate synthase/dihydrofolate synthase [Acidobacteriales bacterium]|nr:bifunctional folylpolyglutamate synthase/dihydrofolate synthase [Terriglobales bacterium]